MNYQKQHAATLTAYANDNDGAWPYAYEYVQRLSPLIAVKSDVESPVDGWYRLIGSK